ncbi:AI-2E family transporter [Neptunicoccus cionae]|uniref:AI-2E family transporter n=1 Tax=Neptunicoccus cionae TaxID=2035344 RepID=A0A916R283_9RHOB|nr:AI-2E family transporter [Amylibacter cionae]GGA29099.1 AI-2E family transporter [Amylibacter cionae]
MRQPQTDQQRITNRMLGVILMLMCFAALYVAKDLVLPLVLGVMLALTLSPFVRAIGRLGVPVPVAAILATFGMAALAITGVALLGGTVTSWFDDIPRITEEVKYKLRDLSHTLQAVKDASEQVGNVTSGGATEETEKVVVQQPGLLTAAVSSLAEFSTSLVVGLILALFLLSSGNMYYLKIVEALPRRSDKKRALRILHDIERRMSYYLLAITTINAGLGVSVGVAMYLVGVPYPLVWGLAAFALNFLPYLGGALGTLGVAAFSLVTFESLTYAMVAPLVYFTLTSLEAQFITPVLLGIRMKMNTVAVFVSVIFWAWLWGIPGALIAVPILAVIKTICDHIEGLSTFGNFLSVAEEPIDHEAACKDTPDPEGH